MSKTENPILKYLWIKSTEEQLKEKLDKLKSNNNVQEIKTTAFQ